MFREHAQPAQPEFLTTKDMNKEKDFVYLATVARITLSMMFGWLYFYEK